MVVFFTGHGAFGARNDYFLTAGNNRDSMFFYDYGLLILAWIFFGLMHSVLASNPVKRAAMQILKKHYRFYRLTYSLFAIACLGWVGYAHFSVVPLLLWQPPFFEKLLAGLLVVFATAIMMVCIVKYFTDLSGIDALSGKNRPMVLQQTGMNAYVRHPLYFGTLLLVWSLFLWFPYLNNLISCVGMLLYTLVGMYFEEKQLVRDYGEAYLLYQQRVPALLPRFLSMNRVGI